MKKVLVYAAATIGIWSSLATVSKLLLDTMHSYVVLCLSALFAAVTLLAVNVANGKLRQLRSFSVKDILRCVLIGLLGTFFYYVFYFKGAQLMSASQAFIINYLWPMMSVVFAVIILKEKMTAAKTLALLLSFAGVFTVAGGDLLQLKESTLTGAVFCVLAAVCYGAFTVLQKKNEADDMLSLMLSFFATFILSLCLCFAQGVRWNVGGMEILGMAWNGVGVMAAATVLWAMALRHGDTAKISNLAYVTPVISLVWNYLILKEKPTLWILAGLGLIIGGIMIQLKSKNQTKA